MSNKTNPDSLPMDMVFIIHEVVRKTEIPKEENGPGQRHGFSQAKDSL